MTRDPALFAEIKDIPWDELPEALDAYVERAEARRGGGAPPRVCWAGLSVSEAA